MTKESTTASSCLVLCHTRELAYQIKEEFNRLGKYLPFKVSVYYGGVPLEDNKTDLRTNNPHIVVGTPGRILDLVSNNCLKLDKLKYFVIDECDKVLSDLKMRYYYFLPILQPDRSEIPILIKRVLRFIFFFLDYLVL